VTDVRVGIVSWNTADLLDRCLVALPAALGGLEAEVVVVDNDSSDGSADRAAGHPGVRVVRNDANVGYARAMNQALAGSDAPVLVALNPDTEPPPGSLATLVRRLHDHPDTAVVVPRLVGGDGRLQHSVYRFPTAAGAAVVCFAPARWQRGRLGRRWWLEGAAPHDESGPVDWAIGAVHVVRAAAVDPSAVYSERWFMYVEDIELCWRVRQHGWRVRLEADVSVPHVGNAAGEQAWGTGRERRYWAASYDFQRLARGPVRARAWAVVNTLGVVYRLVVSALGGRRQQARDLARVLPVHATAVVRTPRPD
jgi:GT2 family glycosyltransferase